LRGPDGRSGLPVVHPAQLRHYDTGPGRTTVEPAQLRGPDGRSGLPVVHPAQLRHYDTGPGRTTVEAAQLHGTGTGDDD
jgi:hypothetical protein